MGSKKSSKPVNSGQSKTENITPGKDKAQQYVEMGVCGLLFAFMLYNFFKGLPIYDLLAVFWLFWGLNNLLMHRATKTAQTKVSAILGIAAGALFTAAYLVQTW
nr:DUF6442 family protein [uncultured Acetobacterium sp.]